MRRRCDSDFRNRRPATTPLLLKVRGLKTQFPVRAGIFGRVRGACTPSSRSASISIAGETLRLVGESGCGKSTTGRSLLRLVDIDAAASNSTVAISRSYRPSNSGRCGATSRWCSRIHSRRSIRA